jgi:hypothetical protein
VVQETFELVNEHFFPGFFKSFVPGRHSGGRGVWGLATFVSHNLLSNGKLVDEPSGSQWIQSIFLPHLNLSIVNVYLLNVEKR